MIGGELTKDKTDKDTKDNSKEAADNKTTKDRKDHKDRKDNKEGAKEKDNPKEGAKEIERAGGTVAARSGAPGADGPADQEAFISPSERPAVGAAAVTGPTVFETSDRGQSWTPVLPVQAQPSALIYTGDRGAYVAVGNVLWRRSDDGSAWTSENLDPGESVTALAVDSANNDTVYLLTGLRVRRRPGRGMAWEEITGNLDTSLGLTALAVAPTKAGADPHVFVGTTIGVYTAGPMTGNTTSWSRVGTSLPDVSVKSLDATPEGILLAATWGRGAWTIPIAPPTKADKDHKDHKDRKDTKEGAKEKDIPKEGAKEIERADGTATTGQATPPGNPVADGPADQEAFIAPPERPQLSRPS